MSWPAFAQVLVGWMLLNVTLVLVAWLVREKRRAGEPIRRADWDLDVELEDRGLEGVVELVVIPGGKEGA